MSRETLAPKDPSKIQADAPDHADGAGDSRSSSVRYRLTYCSRHSAQALPCAECSEQAVAGLSWADVDDAATDPWAEYFPPHLCKVVIETSPPAAPGEEHGDGAVVRGTGKGTEHAGGGVTPHAPPPAREVKEEGTWKR